MSHNKPDGAACIAASEAIEPAIFMAVLGSRYVGGWGKGTILKGQFGFYIITKDYEKAKLDGWLGYVYVLPREHFEHLASCEWRAFKPVVPIKMIEVGLYDLPAQIELL